MNIKPEPVDVTKKTNLVDELSAFEESDDLPSDASPDKVSYEYNSRRRSANKSGMSYNDSGLSHRNENIRKSQIMGAEKRSDD